MSIQAMKYGMGTRDLFDTLGYRGAIDLLPKKLLGDQCVIVDLAKLTMSEENRVDTGSIVEQFYNKTILTHEESPKLTMQVLELRGSSIPWEMQDDSITYVIEGSMDVVGATQSSVLEAGQVFFASQDAQIQLIVRAYVKLLVVMPSVS